MKFKTLKILIPFIFISLEISAEKINLDVAAEAAIMINADTGVILFEKNAHTPLPPASITKVATAWYALKTNRERLNERIIAQQEALASVKEEAIRRSNYTLPSWWIEYGSSHIGIKLGEEMTLKDLLYGLMLRSGNDAANVIAQYVGGSIPNFLEDLNEELRTLGLTQTFFMNPHGLHHPKHLTTAYEMAKIAQAAMHDPIFRDIVRTVKYTRPKTNKNESVMMVQTNQLLRQGKHYYSKAIGVKTGYHSIAQNNLVAAAEYNGRTLITVLMKTKDRADTFVDAKRLFEAAFNQPKVEKVLIKSGSQKFVLNLDGAQKPIKSWATQEVRVHYYPAEAPVLKCLLCWDEALEPPIFQGQVIGYLKFEGEHGEELKRINLYAEEDVKAGWLYWIKNLWKKK